MDHRLKEQFLNICLIISYRFRYLEGAVIPDSDNALGAPGPPSGRRRGYVPSADPGSRLPHMNVRVLSNLSSEVCSQLFFFRFHPVMCFGGANKLF